MAPTTTAPSTGFPKELEYHSGFGNDFASEALAGALPQQNSPAICPYGLYAELMSGTAFTTPRKLNQQCWFYRMKPSVTHESFTAKLPRHKTLASEFNDSNSTITPSHLHWKPPVAPETPTDFIDGLFTLCGSGSPFLRNGFAIHMYAANMSMDDYAFCNADGDFLIIPQKGRLWITTECGRLEVSPNEVVVIPQGFRFAIDLPDGPSQGYVAEIFGSHFELPELGVVGANGLAYPRDFLVPKAWFEEGSRPGYSIVQKFGGELFTSKQDFSPFNVVAWHGNYVPFKYDLCKFSPYNTILFDHGDPTINTVITAPTEKAGTGLLSLTCFGPRWLVGENTFRPPYYHRNCMTEFTGYIYDRKLNKANFEGFIPGSGVLHSTMTPHGPDTAWTELAFSMGNEGTTHPFKIEDELIFMFESCLIARVCKWALASPQLDDNFCMGWKGLKNYFTGNIKN